MAILTNSRTAILLCCCLAAGYLFFSLWNKSWKRFLLGTVSAVAVFAAIFLLYQGIFSIHTANMTQQAITSKDSESISGTLKVDGDTGEVKLEAEAAQNSILKDAGTLNSRTRIWKAAIKAARSSNAVMLRGTDNSATLIDQVHWAAVYTHNSFLEALLTMGIPGLLFAFVFALLAIWRIIRVLFCANISMATKSIALLMTALLAAAILEAYLFQGNINFLYTDFVFCLCLGYLTPSKDR